MLSHPDIGLYLEVTPCHVLQLSLFSAAIPADTEVLYLQPLPERLFLRWEMDLTRLGIALNSRGYDLQPCDFPAITHL